MINAQMKEYNFYTFGEKDEYGQLEISPTPKGTIKIAINTISQIISENVKYKDSTYLGLTLAEVNDTYVIDYGNGERLKVLYVNPEGRYKQVFMRAL